MRSIVITGIDHYYGATFFYVGQRLKIRKDPDNRFDSEAIEVLGAWSAGRIYDTFDQEQEVIVCFIIRNIVIADLIDDAHARS